MNVHDWLNEVAYVKECHLEGETNDCYYSKHDDSYITAAGVEERVEFLANRGITVELSNGTGFSPAENKWYGWSHRAIYGFTIGSTCKKGDCHYRAPNIEGEIENAVKFWDDEYHENTTAEVDSDAEIKVSWIYSDTTPNEKIRGEKGFATWHYDVKSFGRGEWTAETMGDAKQMAIDFSEGVS